MCTEKEMKINKMNTKSINKSKTTYVFDFYFTAKVTFPFYSSYICYFICDSFTFLAWRIHALF